ncbi:filament-like plant protein 7 [Diospyros lotus]|uniref:filament-like plant protein 7 n=1 Tax=Diospyros lotus TaxID=55363 RepID=UPI0022549372|nr:filament-like plant protein 7 [Diospyros lotus]XP_052206079.1 filament-like plant protein 7 [Diospyros lotus]
MDHKTWLWKKKPTEKTIIAADKGNLSRQGNEEEILALLTDKAELERDLIILNEKLSSALSECNSKDDLVERHAKLAQEAQSGWDKAEAEAMSLKQELEGALRQRVADEERLVHLDMALKECMQQLRFVREEQEQRIHDAVKKASREFGKTRTVLEQKLADTNKALAKLGAENTQLSKALLAKEKLIEDLNQRSTRSETDLNALMARLESTEKENASLKYEIRVLEKELEIRNDEREFNRRTANAADKQHLESVKKIAKLESECHRLRILVRKRLPGPAALAKMKTEVEMLGRDQAETRRRKSAPYPTGSMDFAIDNAPDTPNKRINYLTEQLYALEEENRSLKESLNKKTSELQFSQITHARSASRLSQVEVQLEELSTGQIGVEPARNMARPHEISLSSVSEVGSDDKASCSESWASALISELEHFRNGKQMGTPLRRTVESSDIDLMDDFVEMEKLAIVSTDKKFGSPRIASVNGREAFDHLEIQSGGISKIKGDRKVVASPDSRLELGIINQDIQTENILIGKFPRWLQDILKVILEQQWVTQRKPNEILEDIKFALQHVNGTNSSKFFYSRESSISGYISRNLSDKSPLMNSANTVIGEEKADHCDDPIQSKLSRSIRKIIDLIEGISLSAPDNGASKNFPAMNGSHFPYENPETSSGYTARVLQWKTSELSAVLQKFIQSCTDLLNGKVDLENFAEELASALDWVMNRCFSLQDVSSMRDAIKKHFDWDESRSESEVEGGMNRQLLDAGKLQVSREQSSFLPIFSAQTDHKMKETCPNMREKTEKLKEELVNMESRSKNLEGRLQTEIDNSKSLMIQLQEAEKTIRSLQKELETLKESKDVIENQVENDKLVNVDLDTQLKVVSVELNEVPQNFATLERELENKSNCREELEATCLDLQLQLESVTKKEIPKSDANQEEKELRSDWEVAAASEKLAECQETILNLGRQFKALASPRDAALFDKLVSHPSENIATTATPKKNLSRRSSLRDKMLAEDNAEAENPPKVLDVNSRSACLPNSTVDTSESFLHGNGTKHKEIQAVGNSLAIVPSTKKVGGGPLNFLLWIRKKGNSKKVTLPVTATTK